jgi:hypothetical protein
MKLTLDGPFDLHDKYLLPLFTLLVTRYGPRVLDRLERVFRRKPPSRAERRRTERANRKKSKRR